MLGFEKSILAIKVTSRSIERNSCSKIEKILHYEYIQTDIPVRLNPKDDALLYLCQGHFAKSSTPWCTFKHCFKGFLFFPDPRYFKNCLHLSQHPSTPYCANGRAPGLIQIEQDLSFDPFRVLKENYTLLNSSNLRERY